MKFYRFMYKNAYWFLGALGMCVPPTVLYLIDGKVRKLEKGVEKDIERIEKSGRKFSEIPRTF